MCKSLKGVTFFDSPCGFLGHGVDVAVTAAAPNSFGLQSVDNQSVSLV